ncbi:MAG: carbohydrate kinase family protein [Deltaproteobacteria bacterium]|nr:carbohydrate kinase family protein [Deltaproteobacteria bacterium]
MKILVSGSLAYDRIMDFSGKFKNHILADKIHTLNVCFTVNGITEKFGGTAGNIAYSLALLNEQPLILATAGKDFTNYQKWLERHGLSLSGIRIIPEEFTAGAYITTDKSDNQITSFNPGAMGHSSEYHFSEINPADTMAIISPGNLEDMLTYSRKNKKLKIPYIFDPGQSIPALNKNQLLEMIEGSAVFISNDYELEMVRTATGLDSNKILQYTEIIITTLGEKGSIVSFQDRNVAIPPAPPHCVSDPTGAGDAFRSGLIKGMVMGKDIIESARMGSTCASFAVENYGTQEHCFTEDQFWIRHKKYFDA